MKSISFPGGSALMLCPVAAKLSKMKKTVYNAGMGIQADLESLPGYYHGSYACHFVTLTYERSHDWEPNHIKDYLKRLRVWCWRRNLVFRYVWVAELQARGAVHYHILLWLPSNVWLPRSDTRGWWSHGSTNSQRATKAVGYLTKYTSKGAIPNGKKFPKGCRTYGFGGVSLTTRRRIKWWRSSVRVRKFFTGLGLTFENIDLFKIRGGIVDRLTGLFLQSCWKIYSFGKKLVFYQVSDPNVFEISYVQDFAVYHKPVDN